MSYIRSSLFLLFLISWTLFISFIGVITLLTFNKKLIAIIVGSTWAKGIDIYLRHVIGVKIVVKGKKNIPKSPFIIVSRHESMWETCFFMHYFSCPVFILKKELMMIPFYGWYLSIMGMIPIQRGSISAAKKINKKIKKAFDSNRILVIFPESTRVKPNQEIEYKRGINIIHNAFKDVAIIPVALNSGKCWPKGSFNIKRDTIKINFLPAYKNELIKEDLSKSLKKIINSASNKL